MSENQYIKVKNWITANDTRLKIVIMIYQNLPYFMGYAYIAALFYQFFNLSELFDFYTLLRCTFIPAVLLVIVTIFRKLYNAQRPYEVYNITPVVPKDKKGQSMPSRHTACAFAISMAVLHINLIAGIVMLFLAVLVAVSRVICGVHFIKDVVAGAIVAVIVDIAGNALLLLICNLIWNAFIESFNNNFKIICI